MPTFDSAVNMGGPIFTIEFQKENAGRSIYIPDLSVMTVAARTKKWAKNRHTPLSARL